MSRARRTGRSTGAHLALALASTLAGLGVAPAALAQPIPMPLPARWPPPSQSPFDRTPRSAASPAGKGLKGRLGVEIARGLLFSDDPRERMRGVERLGAIDDAPAVEALLEAIDAGSLATRDADTRLHVVRMLAPHAAEARVRAFLTREVLGGSGGKPSLVRAAAAMALARSGDAEALAGLALAIDQRGPASDAARAALLAYPPSTLDPFLLEPREDPGHGDADGKGEGKGNEAAARRAATERTATSSAKETKRDRAKESDDPDDADDEPEVDAKPHGRRPRTLAAPTIDLLSDLGDLRALPALRAAAARKQVVVKARAGLALAKLGDAGGLGDAREWVKGDDPRLLPTATETLVTLGDPSAEAAISKLLQSKDLRASGLALVLGAAKPSLFRKVRKDLEALLKDDPGESRARLVLALARVSPDHAADLLDGPKETRDAAAFALAISPGEASRRGLEARLTSAKSEDERRLLVRAAIVRATSLADGPSDLTATLDRMLASKSEDDREIAALGLVATGTSPAAVLERASRTSPPPASVVAGAARGAMLRGTEDFKAFAPLLRGGETPDAPTLTQIAAGVALLDRDAAADVPVTTLLAWAEGGGALAPLAARALGARDDDTIRSRLRALLGGSDPVVRAHVALGLANDPEPSAVTLLADAYLHEADPDVRRATIEGLAARDEPQRTRVLTWASELDPDEGTRTLARLALEGRKLEAGGARLGAILSMTRIARSDGAPRMTAARFEDATGLSLPVVSAPDGVLLVPAAAYGRARVTASPDEGAATARVAPRPLPSDPPLEAPSAKGQAPAPPPPAASPIGKKP